MKHTILIIINCFLIFQLQAQCEDCVSFEDAFKDPKKVVSLKINSHINKVKIEEIPLEIGQLVNLKVLYLSDHEISSIPVEIKNLTKLKVVSFAGCNLTSIPKEMYQLKKLREVILLNNDFSEEDAKMIYNRFKKELPKTRVMID